MRKKLCHEKRTVSRDRSCVIRMRWCHKERGGVIQKEKQTMSKYKFTRKNVARGGIFHTIDFGWLVVLGLTTL